MKNVQLIRIKKNIQRYLYINKWIKTSLFNVFYPFSSQKLTLKSNEAFEIINDMKAEPITSSIHENIIDKECKYDLTIIIPAYNVSLYIDKCINSILSQKTTYKYKVLVVDDGSSDDTGKIIDSYKEDNRVLIIHQDNAGISASRNRGLHHISSNYIAFVDSDDYLPDNSIQKLLDAAYLNNADIVEGSHYRVYDKKLVKSMTHTDNISSSSNKLIGMPWGKVYKSVLFSKVVFPEKLRFEDSICTFLIYPQAHNIVTIADYVYAYRIIGTSDSHLNANKKHQSLDTLWITKLLIKEHEVLGLISDKEYSSSVIKQIVLNYHRMKKLPENVQKAAFVITSDVFRKYCLDLYFTENEQLLVDAIKALDYGRYKLYCLMN